MNAIDLDTVIAMLDDTEAYRPLIEKAIKVLKSYGPEVYDLAQTLSNATTDLKAEAIKRYVDVYSFTREEVMLLVMDQWSTFTKGLQNAKR